MGGTELIIGQFAGKRTLFRSRLVKGLAASPQTTVVLAAPSGYGKTTVAIQLASSCYEQTVWVELNGQVLSEGELLAIVYFRLIETFPSNRATEKLRGTALIDAVGNMLREREGGALVLDDLVLTDSVVGDLRTLTSLAESTDGEFRIVVTTRSENAGRVASPNVVVIRCDLLRFRPEEVRAVLREESASQLSEETLRSLMRITRGQPALVAVCVPYVLCLDGDVGAVNDSDWSFSGVHAHILWLSRHRLSPDNLPVLYAASLFGRGSLTQLRGVCSAELSTCLESIAEQIPLFTVNPTENEFAVHSIAQDVFLSTEFTDLLPEQERMLDSVLQELVSEKRFTRLVSLMNTHLSSLQKCLALETWGRELLARALYTPTRTTIESLPPALLLSHPKAILLHAELLSELTETEMAQERAAVAKSLAEANEDWPLASEAIRFLAASLTRGGRETEAEDMMRQAIEWPGRWPQGDVWALLLARHAVVAATAGKIDVCDRRLADLSLLDRQSLSDETRIVLLADEGLARAVAHCDLQSACNLWGRALESRDLPEGRRAGMEVNLANAYVMTGRIALAKELAQRLADRAARLGSEAEPGSSLSITGIAAAAEGDYAGAVGDLREAIERAEMASLTWYADQARLDLAIVLRAMGSLDESLLECERILGRSYAGSRGVWRLVAEIEMAATLLACGERAACLSLMAAIENNSDRIPDPLSALKMLLIGVAAGRHLDSFGPMAADGCYLIASGNATWHTAMYVRAFPSLLPVVTCLIGGVAQAPLGLIKMLESGGIKADENDADNSALTRGSPDADAPHCATSLLGRCEVRTAHGVISSASWRKRKARVLFAMLAIRRGQEVSRDQILEHLWPGMDAERARNNFYVVWSAMKAALMTGAEKGAHCPYIENIHGSCRVVPEYVRLDIDEFDEQLERARQAEAEQELGDALAAYERVAELYRGELLPSDLYDDWFASAREHYRCEFSTAMAQAARLRKEAGDCDGALRFVRAALIHDPWREDLYQAAITYQMATGQRGAAIETYLACRHRLAEDLGLDPSIQTRRLYDEILAMEEAGNLMPTRVQG